MFTFDQLYYFCEVYRVKSVTYAAENLHISRQAMSLMINKIERENNITLFIRDNNKLYPTALADEFYLGAKMILEQYAYLDELVFKAQNEKKTDKTITIGIAGYFLSHIGDELLQHLSTLYPDIVFEFVHTYELLSDDVFGGVDLYVGFAAPETFSRLSSAARIEHRLIRAIPMYIWGRRDLFPRKKVDIIPTREVTKLKFCANKQAYNGTQLFRVLNLNNKANKPELPLVQSVYDQVVRENFVALDFPILGDTSFLYFKTFSMRPALKLYQTELSLNLAVFYKPETDLSVINTVISFFE